MKRSPVLGDPQFLESRRTRGWKVRSLRIPDIVWKTVMAKAVALGLSASTVVNRFAEAYASDLLPVPGPVPSDTGPAQTRTFRITDDLWSRAHGKAREDEIPCHVVLNRLLYAYANDHPGFPLPELVLVVPD